MKRINLIVAVAFAMLMAVTVPSPAGAHLAEGTFSSSGGYCSYEWRSTHTTLSSGNHITSGFTNAYKSKNGVACTASIRMDGEDTWQWVRGVPSSGNPIIVRHYVTRAWPVFTLHGMCSTGCKGAGPIAHNH